MVVIKSKSINIYFEKSAKISISRIKIGCHQKIVNININIVEWCPAFSQNQYQHSWNHSKLANIKILNFEILCLSIKININIFETISKVSISISIFL